MFYLVNIGIFDENSSCHCLRLPARWACASLRPFAYAVGRCGERACGRQAPALKGESPGVCPCGHISPHGRSPEASPLEMKIPDQVGDDGTEIRRTSRRMTVLWRFFLPCLILLSAPELEVQVVDEGLDFVLVFGGDVAGGAEE